MLWVLPVGLDRYEVNELLQEEGTVNSNAFANKQVLEQLPIGQMQHRQTAQIYLLLSAL